MHCDFYLIAPEKALKVRVRVRNKHSHSLTHSLTPQMTLNTSQLMQTQGLSYLNESVKRCQVEALTVADCRPDLVDMFKLHSDGFDGHRAGYDRAVGGEQMTQLSTSTGELKVVPRQRAAHEERLTDQQRYLWYTATSGP